MSSPPIDTWGIEGVRLEPLRVQTPPGRTPAILQTNRQIYNETSKMLYSELQLVVRPGNAPRKYTLKSFEKSNVVQGSNTVWRHPPFSGFGRRNANGLTIYNGPQGKGDLEPHVFTQFERLCYQADFNFRGYDGAAL